MVQLGPIHVASPVILAPMAGVTDAPFRRLCRIFGEKGLPAGALEGVRPHVDAPAGLYVCEMITSRALLEDNPHAWQMVTPDPEERVRSVQLYGVNPKVMGEATRWLVERDWVDHVDLNFGCPVPKVTRKGGGAALPWKYDLFGALVGAVVQAANGAVSRHVPVTVKLRVGIDQDHLTFLDAARIAVDQGAVGVTLHARTQKQHYSGHAHWDQIARLRDALPAEIPVFGNGDIFSAADAVAMLEQTGCDAVEVGRGCQGKPWLFWQINAALNGQPVPPEPTLRQIRDVILEHAAWEVESKGDEFRALRDMRKHVGWYLRGFGIGGEERAALHSVSSMEELRSRLDRLDLDQPYPVAAEGKRGRAGGAKTPHLPEGWLDSHELTKQERDELHLAEIGVSGG